MPKLPWLEYTGQTTAELLACKETHSTGSILSAFELGIQAKGESITEEERLVLAVEALQREVNNGGYSQFFTNSSRQYTPIIVDCMNRIGCIGAAEITARAIAAKHDENSLNSCDQDFYQLSDIDANLLRFIELHQDRIQLIRAVLAPPPPRRKLSVASKLYISLGLEKRRAVDLEEAKAIARDVVQRKGSSAGEQDIEAAAALFAFACAIKASDLEACDHLAPLAFELMREDTSHCVLHRSWVELLLAASRWGSADAATLKYLQYLKDCDRSTVGTRNRIIYWISLLQKAPGLLPKSEPYFRENFPEIR